jgi:hypothetical protein
MDFRKSISLCCLLVLPELAAANPMPARTGDAVLKMCQGAEKVKALSVMCHNYLNGFLDASAYAGRLGDKRARFCLAEGDKEHIPVTLVTWMRAHPEALKQDAGEALNRMLRDSYPCDRK